MNTSAAAFEQISASLMNWRPEPKPQINPGRKLDGSQVRRIYRMWQAGETIGDIAEILSLPRDTVARQLAKE